MEMNSFFLGDGLKWISYLLEILVGMTPSTAAGHSLLALPVPSPIGSCSVEADRSDAAYTAA
jgi:hypothetical protein